MFEEQHTMLVGRGMVASKFAKCSGSPDVTIFASGVSNSTETDPAQFAREAALLKQTARNAPLFVYFSSLFDAGKAVSPCAQHKRAMENLAANAPESHLVFRMPQVLGATNNSTNLIGFFVKQLQSGASFRVQAHATRVLIDIDDVGLVCDNFIAIPSLWNRIVHLAPPPDIPVPQIVAKLEQLLDIKGETPLPNVFISTMAQVYSEDRGTNYAIREGRKAAERIAEAISSTPFVI